MHGRSPRTSSQLGVWQCSLPYRQHSIKNQNTTFSVGTRKQRLSRTQTWSFLVPDIRSMPDSFEREHRMGDGQWHGSKTQQGLSWQCEEYKHKASAFQLITSLESNSGVPVQRLNSRTGSHILHCEWLVGLWILRGYRPFWVSRLSSVRLCTFCPYAMEFYYR